MGLGEEGYDVRDKGIKGVSQKKKKSRQSIPKISFN